MNERLGLMEISAQEDKICKNCPLPYCVHDRYPGGVECLYQYAASEFGRQRMQKIDAILAANGEMTVKQLSALAKMSQSTIHKLIRSDIILATSIDVDDSRKNCYIVEAINWPA